MSKREEIIIIHYLSEIKDRELKARITLMRAELFIKIFPELIFESRLLEHVKGSQTLRNVIKYISS